MPKLRDFELTVLYSPSVTEMWRAASHNFAGADSISCICQVRKFFYSDMHDCAWSYKPASAYLAFDYLLSIGNSLLCSDVSKVFTDILMLELGQALVQNKGRDLDFR